MKKLMWAIAFFSLAGTAAVLTVLPDSVPMHYNAAGEIDRWGSKYENLIFPLIILLMALLMSALAAYFGRKAEETPDEKEAAEMRSTSKVLIVTGAAISAMFTIMQGFILYGAYTGAKAQATAATVDIGKVSGILMGVLFIVLGNFIPKTRMNSVIGVRTSWSMYNETTWKKSNRFGAVALMMAGVLTILTVIFMKSSIGAVMVSLVYLTAAVIAILLYARKVYREERAAEEKAQNN